MKIWICEMQREWTTYEWLCKACALAQRSVRNIFGHLVWSKITPLRTLPEWARCNVCEARRQAAPGYVTPTVDVVQLERRAA